MNTKTIYVLKYNGNAFNDESVIEIHESKENAERSMAEHKKNHLTVRFWIEEDLLFLANAGRWLASSNSMMKKPKIQRDPNDPRYYPEDHCWIANAWREIRCKLRRFWKTRILRYGVCLWKGCNYDDSECGHMIGSKTHDQWCTRCDKFRGIPCAEHPNYDTPRSF